MVTIIGVRFRKAGKIYYFSPANYKIKKGDSLVINTKVPVTAEFGGVELSQSKALSDVGQSYSVDLKAFGIIPFTTVNVEVVVPVPVLVLVYPAVPLTMKF